MSLKGRQHSSPWPLEDERVYLEQQAINEA